MRLWPSSKRRRRQGTRRRSGAPSGALLAGVLPLLRSCRRRPRPRSEAAEQASREEGWLFLDRIAHAAPTSLPSTSHRTTARRRHGPPRPDACARRGKKKSSSASSFEFARIKCEVDRLVQAAYQTTWDENARMIATAALSTRRGDADVLAPEHFEKGSGGRPGDALAGGAGRRGPPRRAHERPRGPEEVPVDDAALSGPDGGDPAPKLRRAGKKEKQQQAAVDVTADGGADDDFPSSTGTTATVP